MSIERKFYTVVIDDKSDSGLKDTIYDKTNNLSWDDLYKDYDRILIISTAGTGKTYECKQQTKKLREKGLPAFFLELTELANSNSAYELLSHAEEETFNEWLNTNQIAYFFLDSIDELQLTQKSFEVALRKFTQLIKNNFNRAKVIITSRPISFDVNLIITYLPVELPILEQNNEIKSSAHLSSEALFIQLAMHENKNVTSSFQHQNQHKKIENRIIYVGLDKFSNEDILSFAESKGICNSSSFLEKLLDNHSISIDSARHPQYLMELCHDWKDNNTISHVHKRLEHLIDVLLQQRTGRKEKTALSLEKAKKGIKKLALALILTKKTTILYDETSDNSRNNCFDPRKILTDFTLPELETLLERPIFLPASYGKVRFSHRSITEYLAAQKLNKMIDEGFSIKSAKSLIVNEVNKELILKPSMRDVAIWLACFNPYFFEIVYRQAPELFFQEGDMSLLSDDQKVIVLKNYVERYKKYAWRNQAIFSFHHIDGAACDAMSKAIVELWPNIENEITRFSLMELMAKSPIPECADIAYENVSGKTSTISMDEIRAPSLIILSKLNDSRFEKILNDMQMKHDIWTSENIEKVLLDRLYPYYLKETSIFLTILNCCSFPSLRFGFVDYYWPQELMLFTSKYPIEITKELQEGLTSLIINSISTEGSIYHLEIDKVFLLPALAATCIRLINDGKIDDSVLRSSICCLALFLYNDSCRSNESLFVEIKDLLNQQSSKIREKIFWLCDKFGKKYDNEHHLIYRLIRISSILTLSDQIDICQQAFDANKDKTWIIECLSDQERDSQERLMMLEILLRFNNSGCFIDFNALKDKVADNPTLTKKIEQIILPQVEEKQKISLPLQNEELEKKNTDAINKRKKIRANWHDFYHLILNKPDEAFGERLNQNTVFNLWSVLLNKDMELYSGSWNRELITKIFNTDICNQFREALKYFWRNHSPTLRSERVQNSKNTYKQEWGIGITAISAEAEDSEWATKLSIEEAKLAARYATIELNRFPFWFESLVQANRQVVIEVIGNELKLALEEKLEKNIYHGFLLGQIKKLSPQIANIFSPILMDWINQFDNNISNMNSTADDVERFEIVINLLLINSETNTQNHIKELIQSWLEKYKNNSFFTVSWLKIMMSLSPEEAINQLKKLLIKEMHEKDDHSIAVKWLSEVFKNLWYHQNENYDETLKKLQSIPHVLADLILLAYEYVRPEDDLDRTNGEAYSPGARDHAEEIRHTLLDTLLVISDDNAYQYKINLLESPLLGSSSNYIWDKIQQSQMSEVCEQSLHDDRVIKLINKGIVKPTSNEEMFHLMLDRLEDLEEYLLSDYSPKATWQQMNKEFELRRAIADFLNTRSLNLYTINQEAVTADEKETDIRLVTNSYVAVIELKLGNNWSGKVLRDTISKQLVKQYMQPDNRKAGCLLIITNEKRNWEHPDTGEQLDIGGLKIMLAQEVLRVIKENKSSIYLTVHVLDLCKDIN